MEEIASTNLAIKGRGSGRTERMGTNTAESKGFGCCLKRKKQTKEETTRRIEEQ
jgi:hypothetical protein